MNERADPIRVGALFVDFENIYYALLNKPFELRRDEALSVTLDGLNELRGRLRQQGYALVVERSYADWEQLPSTAQRQLQITGVLPRFADSRIDKNTADIELSLDVLEAALMRNELAHIVLVGGDRDYLPILRRLKELHRSIHVCSLHACLAGDIREFVSSYAGATIIELDELISIPEHEALEPDAGCAASAQPKAPARRETNGVSAPLAGRERCDSPSLRVHAPAPIQPPREADIDINEWHERYLLAILRFLRDYHYREAHLSPFFRWLRNDKSFELVSVQQQRHVFADLKAMGAVIVEERDGGQGYSFSVALPNWNHPLVQRLHDS